MKTSNILLLASSSAQRRLLLEQMKIPFRVIEQSANESACDWNLPFPKLLTAISLSKMDHALLPAGKKGDEIFVLTADSMCQDNKGVIHGKPADKADAIATIKALRQGGIVGTAFCLDKKQYEDGKWRVFQRIEKYVETAYVFDMPDGWTKRYFEIFPQYEKVAGGISVENYGQQFLQSIHGSFTNLMGLPTCEVRTALEEIGFFSN